MNQIDVIIKEPTTSYEIDEYYKLRWEILRMPLGQDLEISKDKLEDVSHHLIALLDKKYIIGVGRIHSLNIEECQIRYMAVSKKYQRYTIGTMLLNNLESHAKKINKKYIVLHARESALNFYIKNRYNIVEKSHLLYDEIQHYLMKKEIK